eukprot:gnl/TRDRNA2_/TRDRNA2_181405_c0_seq1.p1 gnl/TRDRNA2_/TRDRNA2_181405_c0~~gnl/TRDRNA2_/TRDRNA2_181405_c0_seq1.p1  ORF type:complete len:465 (+),score=58.58 gnl/TRDRNA2_/TRDRNA2_181405_c0_seq1:73-1467(+)
MATTCGTGIRAMFARSALAISLLSSSDSLVLTLGKLEASEQPRPKGTMGDVAEVEGVALHRRPRQVSRMSQEGTVGHILVRSTHEMAFESFASKHRRQYQFGTQEYEDRRNSYMKHAAEVDRLNARNIPTLTGVRQWTDRRWTAALNHMADWTDAEIKNVFGWKGFAKPTEKASGRASAENFLSRERTIEDLPKQVDYRNLSAISSAGDQGDCGSCWAVVTSRLLSSHSEIRTGKLGRTFSTQELVDCVPNPHHCGGKGGCDGNTVTLAMDYVMQHGDSTIQETPYVGGNATCKDVSKMALSRTPLREIQTPGVHLASAASHHKGIEFAMKGWELLPTNKYAPLMFALADRGPVGIALDASKFLWYSHGIFDDCDLNPVLSHTALLVGYGAEKLNSAKYWIIQNSWGPSWGEDGHIRVLRSDKEDKTCGIDAHPEMGSACDGGPKEVTVCGTCGILYESIVPHF